MREYIFSQMDYIVFFYGFTFFILTVISYSLVQQKQEKHPWIFFTIFAFIHGVYEVLLTTSMFVGDSKTFLGIRTIVLYTSFLALFELGRGKISKWIYLIIYPLSISGLYFNVYELEVSSRYVLVLLGGFLAFLNIAVFAKRQTKGKIPLYIFSLAFALFVIIAGVVVPQGRILLANVINAPVFLDLFGLPVQLIKGILAIVMAVSLWMYYQNKYIRKGYIFGKLIMVLIILTLLVGGLVTYRTAHLSEIEHRRILLLKTEIAAAAINQERLTSLTLSEKDLTNPDYIRIKEQLVLLNEADQDNKWYYLVALEGNNVYFIADSETPNTPDYVVPGEIYDDYPEEIVYVFTQGVSVTSKSYSDKWGQFVSAFVPIRDFETNEVIAVIGSDITTQHFNSLINLDKSVPMLVTALLMIILLATYLSQLKNAQMDMKLMDSIDDLHKYKLAVDNVEEHIVITDYDGITLYANSAVEKITGYSKTEAMGAKAGTLWGRQMPKEAYKNMWETLKTNKQTYSGEIRNKRKNGELYDAAVLISPVLDGRKNVKYFVGIERDITKPKEVDRMKTEFVSLVSHQLRSPLTGIKWGLEMLVHGDYGKLTKKQLGCIANIETANNRMVELVNALLNISRIESGRIAIDPVPTDLVLLIDTAVKEQNVNIMKKNIKLSFSNPTKVPDINIDPNMFSQVITNLLTNAIKYTPQSGKIDITLTNEGTKALIKVVDTGYGIPQADKDKVFSKFYRGENIIPIIADGTGLGLYLVKEIVEASQAKVWFESELNKGTTFYVEIPLSGTLKKEGIVSLSS